jgi:hypothetical protein
MLERNHGLKIALFMIWSRTKRSAEGCVHKSEHPVTNRSIRTTPISYAFSRNKVFMADRGNVQVARQRLPLKAISTRMAARATKKSA